MEPVPMVHITQGRVGFALPDGSEAPAAGSGAWDVLRNGVVVASQNNPADWHAAWDNANARFVLRPPLNAPLGLYQVRSSGGQVGGGLS